MDGQHQSPSSPQPSSARHTSEPLASSSSIENNTFEFSQASNLFNTPGLDFDFTSTNFDTPHFTPSSDSLSGIEGTVLNPDLLASTQTQGEMLSTISTTHDPNQHGYPPHSSSSSLTPSSAVFGLHGVDAWGIGTSFQGHRRTLSDAHSDVSSNPHSPYMQPTDNFDFDQTSNLNQDPSMYQDAMAIGSMSIAESAQQSYISPVHSPHHSPRLPPTQTSPQPYALENFSMLNTGISQQYHQLPVYSNVPNEPSIQEPFPSLPDMQSDRPTPEIKFELIAPSRQPTMEIENRGIQDSSALSPPEKSRGRRNTAPSGSRGGTPSSDMLAPHPAGVGSRSPSPNNRRRSLTSTAPNRDYILDLADKNRPSSHNSDTAAKRTQKHPATFQCSLCPKRFTRAYNLRSHLRTHTDERPFVCGVCGKAFARQHDRKRHEGLHTGEKKFICQGKLKDGQQWGCSRRFARADALGRHFRSEAGRLCIKPLMDEEAIENGLVGHPMHLDPNAPSGGIMPGLGVPQNMGPGGMPMPDSGFTYGVPGADGYSAGMMAMQAAPPMQMQLPRAILTQYPALQGIWDQLPMTTTAEDVDDGSNMRSRGSFSSNGGEFEDDGDWSSGGGPALGWASDVGP